MTQTAQILPYTVRSDEKVAQVMVYTDNALYWGDVVTKSIIRVSTWLRTNTAPDRVTLYNAKAMYTTLTSPSRPMQFSELHIATTQVLAFHLVPPAKDPLDFDLTEPNRRMVPISMLVGNFRIEGSMRLAGSTTLFKFLEVTKEAFSAIYDVQISNPMMPAFGVVNVPFMILRQEKTIFALAQPAV